MKERRRRALSSDAKANELQAQVSTLRAELEKLRKEKTRETNRNKNPAANSHESPNEMEKRVLVCRLKENRQANDDCCKQQESLDNGRKKTNTRGSGLNALKRSPFREIGNSSSLATQNSKGVLPLHCPPAFQCAERFLMSWILSFQVLSDLWPLHLSSDYYLNIHEVW